MNVFQIMRNMSTSQRQADHLVLKNGQIVNATLLDMFDNGDAKLNIHGFMVRAQLEAPMTKGEHTFMQVQSFKDGLVNMKIISNERHTSSVIPDSNIQQMLKNTSMPNNAAWRQIVQEMIQRNIPLLPDTMAKGVQLLGRSPSMDMANSWMNMLERNIPANQATLTAVHQINNGPAINQLLTNLQEAISKQIELITPNQAGANDTKFSQTGGQPPGLSPSQMVQLAQEVISQEGQKQAQASESQVKVGQVNIQEALSANLKGPGLDKSQVANTNTGVERSDLSRLVARETLSTSQREVQESLLRLNNLIKDLLQEGQRLTQSQTRENMPTREAKPAPEVPLAQENTGKGQEGRLLDQAASKANSQLNPDSKGIVTELKAEQATPRAETAPVLQVLKAMGLNHEKESLQALQKLLTEGTETTKDKVNQLLFDKNLKEELLNIINNRNIPPVIREISGQLLNNITGQQLLSTSHDSQNVFHNAMFQIPISWGDKEEDTLNLQIQGKKGKKSIDPNNCSIYLEVAPPSLGELGVYVNIVNKVVSVRLFSEHEGLQNLVDLTFSLLSSGLDEQGYKLSFIKLEDGKDKGQKEAKDVSAYKKLPSKGFDVRV